MIVTSAALNNFSLETFIPNLVFLTCPSLQVLHKTQTEVFSNSGFLVKSPKNNNFRNSRTRNDSDMKLAPVTKFHKINTAASK